jgi:hypothetical protein
MILSFTVESSYAAWLQHVEIYRSALAMVESNGNATTMPSAMVVKKEPLCHKPSAVTADQLAQT